MFPPTHFLHQGSAEQKLSCQSDTFFFAYNDGVQHFRPVLGCCIAALVGRPAPAFVRSARFSIVVLVIVKIMGRYTSPHRIGDLGPGGSVRVLLNVVKIAIRVGQGTLDAFERQ
jgi:hypothetical protein